MRLRVTRERFVSKVSYRFDGWTFNPASGELSKGGALTRLRPQPAALLTLLLERAGTVVSREEIIARVWPETVVEYDQAVNYTVRAIRVALGESGSAATYIETLPRRGYRFRVPVETIQPHATRFSRPRAVLFAVSAAVILLALGWFARPMVRLGAPPVAGRPPDRVAVMVLRHPPADTGASQNAMAFAERLTVALTDAMSGSAAIIGPTTTGPYGTERDVIPRLAQELGVTHVLGGSITPDRDDPVFLEFIRVDDRAHLWAATGSVAGRALIGRAADTVVALMRGPVRERAR